MSSYHLKVLCEKHGFVRYGEESGWMNIPVPAFYSRLESLISDIRQQRDEERDSLINMLEMKVEQLEAERRRIRNEVIEECAVRLENASWIDANASIYASELRAMKEK